MLGLPSTSAVLWWTIINNTHGHYNAFLVHWLSSLCIRYELRWIFDCDYFQRSTLSYCTSLVTPDDIIPGVYRTVRVVCVSIRV